MYKAVCSMRTKSITIHLRQKYKIYDFRQKGCAMRIVIVVNVYGKNIKI